MAGTRSAHGEFCTSSLRQSVPSATSTAVATSTTATWPIFSWLGFVYSQGTSIELAAIQSLHGFVPAITHFDERETPWSSGFPIHDDLYFRDGPVLRECLS